MKQPVEYKILKKVDAADIDKEGFFEIPPDVNLIEGDICNGNQFLKKIRFSKQTK